LLSAAGFHFVSVEIPFPSGPRYLGQSASAAQTPRIPSTQITTEATAVNSDANRMFLFILRSPIISEISIKFGILSFRPPQRKQE
jgi:hypothetical protein